jgi:uncharacterized protein YndB with AHSA1/START domain
MVDILHRVGIQSSSLDDVYEALTTHEGLSGWWANDTQGESEVGEVLQFRFEPGGIDIEVLELHPAKSVLWQVVDGPEGEWGVFLMSLKSLLESGKGAPEPRDIKIDNWN